MREIVSQRKNAYAVVASNQDRLDLLLEVVDAQREIFRRKLLVHGALLFRGFAVESAADFEIFARAFAGRELFNYAGGVSPRRALGGAGVYTSTEYPPDVGLSLHNELSYADTYPEQIFFGCLTAPTEGGETTIGDSRRILRRLDPQIVEIFKDRKIRYIRNFAGDPNSEYSWPAAFETEDRRAAERVCARIGADFAWQPDGRLQLSQTRPATVVHPATGEEVWFNQADGFHPSNLGLENYEAIDESEFRLNCTFGDGAPIPLAALAHVRDALRREAVPHVWQKGDVLVLDNLLAAHGRRPFSGARKIAVAMA